jgi:hypothetical protein
LTPIGTPDDQRRPPSFHLAAPQSHYSDLRDRLGRGYLLGGELMAKRMITTTVRTNAQLRKMHLSYYTLCKLADALHCVDPQECLEHRLTHPAWQPGSP